jgi:hypothetical protein
MPNENDSRPCVHQGCKGTQTYTANASPPGSQAGVASKDGALIWGANRRPGWSCDIDRNHFDAVREL